MKDKRIGAQKNLVGGGNIKDVNLEDLTDGDLLMLIENYDASIALDLADFESMLSKIYRLTSKVRALMDYKNLLMQEWVTRIRKRIGDERR